MESMSPPIRSNGISPSSGNCCGFASSVGYVGSKSTHLKGEYDQNAPIYNNSLTLAQNRPHRRPAADPGLLPH